MPRPREFDLDTALEAATERFWLQGYEATSLNDLLDAIGIHKGSLYKAFGDKHSLYFAALEKYLSRMRNDLTTSLEGASSPRRGLEEWLRATALRCACPDAKKGCFAVNAIVELAPRDEQVRELLREHDLRLEGLVASVLERGRQQGELAFEQRTRSVARYILTAVFGLYVSGKARRLSRSEADRLVELILIPVL